MRTFKIFTITLAAAVVLLITSSPAWATFPGENGKIVFVCNQSGTWQLYTINPDASGMAQITNLPATLFDLWAPSFSPDGQRIVFSYGLGIAFNGAQPNLYVINTDGTGLTQLTNDGRSFWPHWSPDGTRIVFLRIAANGVGVVTTMRADGTGEKSALTSDFWNGSGAIYTPDGAQIVFGSQQGGYVSRVWITDADGSNQTALTAPELEVGPMDVSPDGHHIVAPNGFNVGLPIGVSGSLFVMNLEGKGVKQLTYPPTGENDFWSSYSPDGTKVVFARGNATVQDLFVVGVDGSNPTRIASGVAVGGCPYDGNCVTPGWGRKP